MGKAAFDHTTRRQTCVAKSTAVAESYALADAVEQVRGHVEFIKELGLNIHKPLPVYNDNAAAVFNSANIVSRRTKHAAIRFALVREAVQLERLCDIVRISTYDNAADGQTKLLGMRLHVKHAITAMNVHGHPPWIRTRAACNGPRIQDRHVT